MHENTRRRVTFLVNLMFSRLDKFNGPMFGGRRIYGGLIFGILIGLHIWGEYIRGGRINGVLWYLLKNSLIDKHSSLEKYFGNSWVNSLVVS